MLLLRAFYEKFRFMQDSNSKKTFATISKCIWKTNEFEEPDLACLKIDSQVASDNDKAQFLEILRTGQTDPKWKSAYAANFRFFVQCIDELVSIRKLSRPCLPQLLKSRRPFR